MAARTSIGENLMKLCITAQANNLEANVDERFGRCAYFVIYDTESSKHEIVENSYAAASGGAGIQAAQFMVDQGVSVVLTGNQPGPKAMQILNTANIKVINNIAGPIKNAIVNYQNS